LKCIFADTGRDALLITSHTEKDFVTNWKESKERLLSEVITLSEKQAEAKEHRE